MAYPKLPLKQELPPAPKPARISHPRWQKWLGILVVAGLLAALGFVGAEAYRLSRNVFVANTGDHSAAFDLTSKPSGPDWSQFRQPGDGRVNILVLGIGGISDSGVAHSGTYLTDSIELVSFNTINHTAALTSIPRDLEVKTPDGYGYEKINAVYEGADGSTKGGGDRVKAVMGNVLGIKISNYAVIDFTAAKNLVDAVGGIDINVPNAIYDPTYPADNDGPGYAPFSIAAGQQHLSGTVALKYMRTRHDDSDFARSGRQQTVFAALQQKALTLGVLGNPAKVNQIVTALGSHVKTDLTLDETSKLVTTLKQISSGGITSNVLDTSDKLGLLVSNSDPDLGYVEQPAAGLTNFTAIHNWFQTNTPDPLIAKEAATIQLNNAGTTKANFTVALTQLTSAGFKATAAPMDSSDTTAASTKTPTATTIRVHAKNTHPVTLNYLTTMFGGTVVIDSALPAGVDIVVDYVPAKPTAKATAPAASSSSSATTSSTTANQSSSGASAWTIE